MHAISGDLRRANRTVEMPFDICTGGNRNFFTVDGIGANLELCDFLAATDIYVTSYLNREQITSGTLAKVSTLFMFVGLPM